MWYDVHCLPQTFILCNSYGHAWETNSLVCWHWNCARGMSSLKTSSCSCTQAIWTCEQICSTSGSTAKAHYFWFIHSAVALPNLSLQQLYHWEAMKMIMDQNCWAVLLATQKITLIWTACERSCVSIWSICQRFSGCTCMHLVPFSYLGLLRHFHTAQCVY